MKPCSSLPHIPRVLSPALTLPVLGQAPQGRPQRRSPVHVFSKDVLPGETNKGAEEARWGTRSPQARVQFQEKSQQVEPRNVSYVSELSQHLWVAGLGCPREEIPGPLLFG